MDVVILYFSKAFDKVSHKLLISKLTEMGITGDSHTWISAFLSNRTQRVGVNGEFSPFSSVDSGVPQGTVLGPLLFLCYINDLPACVKSQTRLFADDCLLYRSIKSENDYTILQRDLSALESWAETWKMHFNPKKCYVMSFHRTRSPLKFNYILCQHTLVKNKANPYLGCSL